MVDAASKIGILDDDESVRRAFRRLLKSEGLSTIAFASAEEFLDARGRHEFTCLIVDIHLGKISGLELAELLVGEGSRIPIIVITAYDSETARETASRLHVHAYLRKPVDAAVLLDAVRRAVDSRGVMTPAGAAGQEGSLQ